MKTYLVGGAVRDRLLGLDVRDRDFVVVGARADQMSAQGFRPVGKDFPVFLHPDTNEEYALARTERKTAPGYRGFVVHSDADVSLEDDLRRRDLTINAIAEDTDGSLIDPFGGVGDLHAKLLRHVSPAFAEDPVRILRVARFAARYANRGFRVADETLQLMRSMVDAGEADHLVAERVWTETQKALGEPAPVAFVRILRACGALKVLFPQINALYGVPQRAEYHPEVDSGIHTELVLEQIARLAPGDALLGWCALTHDLGKALTPAHVLPRHHGHEHAGAAPIDALCARLKVPAEYLALAQAVCRLHLLAHTAFELKASTILGLFEQLDAFRRPQRLAQFLLVCEADKRGRLGLEQSDYPQADFLQQLFQSASKPSAKVLVDRGLSGPEVGEALRKERIHSIAATQALIRHH